MTLAQLELLSWLKLVLKLMVNWDGEEISSHLRVIMNQAPHREGWLGPPQRIRGTQGYKVTSDIGHLAVLHGKCSSMGHTVQ